MKELQSAGNSIGETDAREISAISNIYAFYATLNYIENLPAINHIQTNQHNNHLHQNQIVML